MNGNHKDINGRPATEGRPISNGVKLLHPSCVLIVILCLIGCPRNEPVQPPAPTEIIKDDTGVSFGLPMTPTRIISLAPAITENIKLLGAQSRLVGRTNFCKVSGNVDKVGTILEPSIEKMVSLKPDIVLATKEANNPATITKLRKLGIKAFVFGESLSWQTVEENFRLMGKLFGESDKAEQIIKTLQERLNGLTKSDSAPKILVQLNTTPLMTSGPDTFINDIIAQAGGVNIAADSPLKWPVFSLEAVIKLDPDIIVISDMGSETTAAREIWQRFPELTAVKNNHIHIMESDFLCQPTPANFVKGVEQMIKFTAEAQTK